VELPAQEIPVENYNHDKIYYQNGYNYRWRKMSEWATGPDDGKRVYMISVGMLDHSILYDPTEKTISCNGTKFECKNTREAEFFVTKLMKGNNVKPGPVYRDIVIENIEDIENIL
jgi:hypothetical protein